LWQPFSIKYENVFKWVKLANFQYTAVKQELDRARNAGGMVLLSGGYGYLVLTLTTRLSLKEQTTLQECAVSRYVALLSTATHYVTRQS
jgi:hypothetical protein